LLPVYYMYYSAAMPKPPKAPTSLRIPEATRVRVEKWATERGIPRNAAYVELIERGLKAAGPRLCLDERPLRAKPKLRVTKATPLLVEPPVVGDHFPDEPMRMPRAPIGSRLDKKTKR
jgi:hypothetical protein